MVSKVSCSSATHGLRFRDSLELGLSTLDAVSEGVAVFSSSGKLGFCNSAFKELWEVEPELSIAE